MACGRDGSRLSFSLVSMRSTDQILEGSSARLAPECLGCPGVETHEQRFRDTSDRLSASPQPSLRLAPNYTTRTTVHSSPLHSVLQRISAISFPRSQSNATHHAFQLFSLTICASSRMYLPLNQHLLVSTATQASNHRRGFTLLVPLVASRRFDVHPPNFCVARGAVQIRDSVSSRSGVSSSSVPWKLSQRLGIVRAWADRICLVPGVHFSHPLQPQPNPSHTNTHTHTPRPAPRHRPQPQPPHKVDIPVTELEHSHELAFLPLAEVRVDSRVHQAET